MELNTMNLDRRKFIIRTASTILAATLSTSKAFAFTKLFYQDATDGRDAKSANLDVLYKLSQWVTYREHLSKDAAQKLYKIFENEPWGKEHIVQVYNKIRRSIQKSQNSYDLSQLLKSDLFNDGEKWFISHVITTWYLGVYYHETSDDTRVLYEDALMFESLDGIAPIPYRGNITYGQWEYVPEGKNKQ